MNAGAELQTPTLIASTHNTEHRAEVDRQVYVYTQGGQLGMLTDLKVPASCLDCLQL